MKNQQPLQQYFDVYISYPPGINQNQVNENIRQNLSSEEAEEVILALEENRQALMVERCTNEERLNAQHYFGYLGLDVIIRVSLELMPDEDNNDHVDNASSPVPQCVLPFLKILIQHSVRHVNYICGLRLKPTFIESVLNGRSE